MVGVVPLILAETIGGITRWVVEEGVGEIVTLNLGRRMSWNQRPVIEAMGETRR